MIALLKSFMAKPKYKASIGSGQAKTAHNPELLKRIEELVNKLHDDEGHKKLQDYAEDSLMWAWNNITVGSLVESNCVYLVNLFVNKPTEEGVRAFVGEEAIRYHAGTQALFLGFDLIRVWRSNIGEPLEVPTFEMRHKWMINDKILLVDIHPMHFSLSKKGTGKTWGEAFEAFWVETIKKLDDEHGDSQHTLRQPRYESMVNFWSGAMADNPVRIDAFLSE